MAAAIRHRGTGFIRGLSPYRVHRVRPTYRRSSGSTRRRRGPKCGGRPRAGYRGRRDRYIRSAGARTTGCGSRPPGNRHAQAPQADPAAVALVPHDEVNCAREEQETQHQHEIAQKEGNALRERGKQVLLRREDAGDQFQHAPPSHSRDGQFDHEPCPVAHTRWTLPPSL